MSILETERWSPRTLANTLPLSQWAGMWEVSSHPVMVMEMDTATRVQILDLTDCISHSTNTLGEGINPIILPPAMGK